MAKETKKTKKKSESSIQIADSAVWKWLRLLIVIGGTVWGGWQLAVAFEEAPFEPIPTAPFTAFGLAIVALAVDRALADRGASAKPG